MTITLNIANLRDSAIPMYGKYESEINPQPAYVQLDEDGEVSAGWSGEIGNGVPMTVWHQQTLRFEANPYVSGDALADYLESEAGMALLTRIHEGHEVDWDGSNHVGRLSDDAQAAVETLERDLENLQIVEVMSAADYLFSFSTLLDIWSGKPIDDIAAGITLGMADFDGVVDGDIRDALLTEAERQFDEDGDDELEQCHIDALIADGRITQEQADARATAKSAA